MKFYYSSKGPNILVECYVRNSVIYKTNLMENLKPGFGWCVDWDYSCRSAREMICEWMLAYAEGRQVAMRVPLVSDPLPPFTQKIIDLMKEIPFGQTVNYKEMATRAGNPNGARAAGAACGRNPFPLLVPCHRVLAVGGKIGGFACGGEVKKRLLEFEGAI